MTISSDEPQLLLGNHAVALGALRGGIHSAYGYPGTPSTEIMEFLQAPQGWPQGFLSPGRDLAQWCANEKTALEAALGCSYCGQRSLVVMKHVGLNVAADPFMNSALVKINGGLVLAVADDPAMHSSQNEQDSREYGAFAHIPCLEPASAQEASDMVVAAFTLSEAFHMPVLLRLCTRISHARGLVRLPKPLPPPPGHKPRDRGDWLLLPARSRVLWDQVVACQSDLEQASGRSPWNTASPGVLEAWRHGQKPQQRVELGVLCTGSAWNQFMENLPDLEARQIRVEWVRISQYPLPRDLVRCLAASCRQLLILEEGYPMVERQVRGILEPGPDWPRIRGRLDLAVPRSGELDPVAIRPALGLPLPPRPALPDLPGRPPRLCAGCSHQDSYRLLNEVMQGRTRGVVCADIGCYALGALPPFDAVETIVCMGASIGMARGASRSGYPEAVAVIGDSTFWHSGLTPLMDALAAGDRLVVLILDNGGVAMTGGQDAILPGERIAGVCKALGVLEDHCHVLEAHPRQHQANREILVRELEYPGVSVVVMARECVETARKRGKP